MIGGVAVGGLAMFLAGGIANAQVRTEASPPPMERVPAGDEWELDFVPKALRLHVDEVTKKRYWVLTYEVGNRTGRPRTWAPVFELMGDEGQVLRSGQNVPSHVTADVKRRLNDSLLNVDLQDSPEIAERPPVLDQNQAIGLLPVGRDHIRDGFAIWPAILEGEVAGHDLGPTLVTVFVGGVSNRRGTIDHPITGEEVVLRQQQVVSFQTPGWAYALAGNALKPISETSVYR